MQQYSSILKGYLLPEFGALPLKDITLSRIKKFQARIAIDLSPVRVNTVIQLMRSITSQAVRDEELDRDPCMSVRRLQEPKVEVDPLSETELAQALDHIDSHFKPLFTCLDFTGARPNELQALRWGDIDWTREEIRISKGRVRGKEGLPETKSSDRKVPMTEPVREALDELKARGLRSAADYVFVNKKGLPIDKHLDRIWARALKQAKLRHRPSYQLRHTFATNCIIKGLPLPFIAKVLGHSTIDTLIRHYAGWIDSATSENNEKLKKAFKSAETTPKIPRILSAV